MTPTHASPATPPVRRPAPGPDHAELVDALAAADLSALGARIRQARVGRGVTQAAACSDIISTAYLSRIESGSRRPDLKVLHALAERLATSAHELLLGLSSQSWSSLEVEHDWAQLSLRTGDADAALAATTRLLDHLPQSSRLARRAQLTHALALEATGDYERAAMQLEDIVEADGDSAPLDALIALSRVYREAGELGRAIEVGDRAQGTVAARLMEGSPEGIRLTLTVAGAHNENGDVGYAVRLCRKALTAAERLDHAGAKASCYWNASVFESRRGNQREAVELAHRALATLDEADSARHASNLRTQLGILLLRLDPPRVDEALDQLVAAETSLTTANASPADVADNRLAQARAHFLGGDSVRARAKTLEVRAEHVQNLPLLAAEAAVLLGQIEFHDGDVVAARAHYQSAIASLTAVGADRSAAQLWFELGGLWLSVGGQDEALDAFQRAGASTGLRSTVARPVAAGRSVSASRG